MCLATESVLYGMQMCGSSDISPTSAMGDEMSHDGPHTATPPVCCLHVSHVDSITYVFVHS